MKPERLNKFRRVAAGRQPDLTVILENVTDWHNIGAVLRSCDSVGIGEVFLLNTEPHLATKFIIIGKKTSGGSRKWVDVHYYTDPAACFAHVREKCHLVLSTALTGEATDLFNLDLTQPVAFLFGNEHSGLSEETARYADGNFVIPQVGMSESLNISVACAVTLYEAYRQRKAKGLYKAEISNPFQESLLNEYLERHERRERGRMKVKRKG